MIILTEVIILCVLYSYYVMTCDHIRDSFLQKTVENRRVVSKKNQKSQGFSPTFF